MKLYELEKGIMFNFADEANRMPIKFDHIDGAYSVCYAGSHVVHIEVNTEVIPCLEYNDIEGYLSKYA
jgi:hypothetical protein